MTRKLSNINNMKLEDLIPEESSITLSATGKTYHFRPFSLVDEAWLKKRFGDELDNVFKKMKMKEVCEIAFHQMKNEDKADFVKTTVKIIDDNGDELTQTLGGVELLMTLIVGTKEKVELVKSMLQNIGISRAMQDDLEKKSLEEKKVIKQETNQDSL